MRVSGLMLLVASFVGGCGVNEARTKSLTDMKSVLLYQHVEADRFRLLACPYAVDLDVARDCSNAFFTPAGAEYYFTGIPQQPWVFAPSQATVKSILTVPVVIGGAVLSWVALRKLLTKIRVDTAKKELRGGRSSAKNSDDATQAAGRQATKRTAELTDRSYRVLVEEIEESITDYPEKFRRSMQGVRLRRPRKPLTEHEVKTVADINTDLERERAFVAEQFALVTQAMEESELYETLFAGQRWWKRPKEPASIFKKFEEMYDKTITETLGRENTLIGKERVVEFRQADAFVGKIRQVNDKFLTEDGQFIDKFTQLVARPDVRDTIRANRSNFRRQVADTIERDVEERSATIAALADESARRAGNVRDYLLAALGGLLAGSYLPDKIPPLEKHFFTAREWQKLFARDDNFKKPMRITDSYTVVKKLTRYLKRKGEEVVINEQVFFGLKN